MLLSCSNWEFSGIVNPIQSQEARTGRSVPRFCGTPLPPNDGRHRQTLSRPRNVWRAWVAHPSRVLSSAPHRTPQSPPLPRSLARIHPSRLALRTWFANVREHSQLLPWQRLNRDDSLEIEQRIQAARELFYGPLNSGSAGCQPAVAP